MLCIYSPQFLTKIPDGCNPPRATDEVFQILEDNQVMLSTMKASRYVRAFDKEVDKWERTLSHILEVIEMILQVQKQWMYLEVGEKGKGKFERVGRP